MRRYELIVVLSPDVADEDVSEVIERLVRQPVESQGGELQASDQWGRRKLAYPIQRFLEANYVATQLRLDPQATKDLERGLQISEEVLRHLLVRLDEAEETPAPAEA